MVLANRLHCRSWIPFLAAVMGCVPDATPDGREERWRSEVTARIRDASRTFEPTSDGYRAEVVERSLTGTFEPAGVTLAFGADAIEVSTIGWAEPTLGDCVDHLSDPSGACIRRLEYAGVDRTEWWVGGADGFQQGWTIETRDEGSEDLAISIAVSGAEVIGTDTGLWLQGDKGGVLVVDGLAAWDADGTPLSASFTSTDGGFEVNVADARARYPITIDPVYTTPSWQVEGAQADDFGTAVAGAGDVNGDGYDDVIVGASSTTSSTGSAYVFLGSAAGVSSTADATLTGGSTGALFGGQVAGAGDVNDDGYDDVIVGAIGHDEYRGRASVFLGSSAGISTTADTDLDGGESSDYLGTAVAAAGDVNNDGYDDVIVGAGGYGDVVGRAYVFHGSASGVSTAATTTLTGEAAENYFAWTGSLSGAGDVNNDGYDDVIVGAAGYDAFSGRAYVYLGSSTGVASVADLTLTGSISDALGGTVSRAGDVNNDGYGDVIIGARGYDSFTGRAYIHHGSATGVSSSPALTLTGSTTGERFADHLTGAGDVNDDGYDDVAVGASAYDTTIGSVGVYLGSSSGVSGTASSTITGDYEYEGFATVSGAGDVDNDGYADLIVGGSRTRASVFHGSSGGVSSTAVTTVTGVASSDGLGISVSRAGDVDNDGYDDVIVGASGYLRSTGRAYVFTGSSSGLSSTADTTLDGLAEGHGFGSAVGNAGDVDNDGYDDVIVGACGSATDADSAYIYLGSATGVSATATTTLAYAGNGCALSGAGDVNGDGYDDVIVGNYVAFEALVFLGSASGVSSSAATTLSGSADFGTAVSDAGDVNDDGYDDVIVGAAGVANVFHGSSAGLASTAATVTDQPAGDETNRTVSGAGDVNDDGYDDVIVGAPTPNRYSAYSSRMFIYLGSSSGVSPTEATSIEGGLQYAYSVSGAGDVDNDGYDDVIVGAPPSYSGSGYAYVYVGSAAGLSTTVDSELTIGESEFDQFGVSVSGAGDVNNDGYDDVIVGAPSERSGGGRAHTFHGYGSTPPAVDDDGDGYDDTVDCDDADAAINPGAIETCDGFDQDCDSLVDDADPDVTGTSTWYADTDGDGYGDMGAPTTGCAVPAGYVADAADCDDTDADVFPTATELAGDAIDQNCDGLELCYVDADNDGYTSDETTVESADQDCDDVGEALATAPSGDCDGADADFHPNAPETDCEDPMDYNCDGSTGFADADGDGFAACKECDDASAAVNPDAVEVCNGIDDDCDGTTDEGAADASTWYADADADGYTEPTISLVACAPPEGFAEASATADCDDNDANTSPAGHDVPDDGIDQDCSGEDATPPHAGGETGQGGDTAEPGCDCHAGGSAWLSAVLPGALAFRRRRRSARGRPTSG